LSFIAVGMQLRVFTLTPGLWTFFRRLLMGLGYPVLLVLVLALLGGDDTVNGSPSYPSPDNRQFVIFVERGGGGGLSPYHSSELRLSSNPLPKGRAGGTWGNFFVSPSGEPDDYRETKFVWIKPGLFSVASNTK
jgi:hypothetical protein